ncbi:MAG: glycosyltransferase family 2 protein [Candidatus Omnitrophica bacterium]|nr:glycosyltransferase family 2 protein [Candidatus Omnitrophota bacterium]
MNKRNISLSVCVPAFNEEENIEEAVMDLISVLSASVERFEIIIVDDASIDSTLKIATRLSENIEQVKVLRHIKNQGIGACYRNALSVAECEYFTWFPSDHENYAKEIADCVPHLKNNCIVTSHHLEHDRRPVFRKMLSRLYTWILNKSFGMNLKYYNGLTIFPVKVLRSVSLAAKGFAFSAESIIHSAKLGCEVVELSAPLRGRNSGKSKALSLSSILRMCKDYRFIFSKRKKLL